VVAKTKAKTATSQLNLRDTVFILGRFFWREALHGTGKLFDSAI
jgi:hypothetical protein